MKVAWSVDAVVLKEISTRERRDDRTGVMSEYKVVKFYQKKDEVRSCVCFDSRISRMLGIGLVCALKGEVTFSSGSTFLVVKNLILN